MKIIASLALALATTLTLHGQTRTVVNPDFDSNTANINFSITEVALSDSATAVKADIYQLRNNWVRLVPGCYLHGRSTGKNYPMKEIRGMGAGEKVTMRDSTYISTSMIFPPLDKADTIFDFIEPGGWEITGLKLNSPENNAPVTHVSGTVNDNPDCSWLILAEANKDIRVNKCRLIPVREGKFEFDLKSPDQIVYSLSPGNEYLNGSWRSTFFFTEGGNVEITIGDRESPITVTGGKLTQELSRLEDRNSEIINTRVGNNPNSIRFNEMQDTEEAYTEEFKKTISEMNRLRRDNITPSDSLFEKFNNLVSNDNHYTPEARQLKENIDNLVLQIQNEWVDTLGTIKSPVALFMFARNMMFAAPSAERTLEVFSREFADTLTDHPYHKYLSALANARTAVPGNKYPDFTAPDLNGNMLTLSELINGKVAVIDLWASWCGPCRRHSMAMIPIYEKYKDKGFTVVGIARENGSTKAMEKAIERDGYPWTNLVELNDRAGIWSKYQAGNGGGKIVLVDRNGTIIAVDPTPEEIISAIGE